jgi:hypothetical protein
MKTLPEVGMSFDPGLRQHEVAKDALYARKSHRA